MATVNDLYKITKDLMVEKGSSKIYDEPLLTNVNRLLVELFNENNYARIFNGKSKLTSPQKVTSRSDELVYEDEYVYNVLPLGLAARFFIDDDLNKYTIFNTDYNNARVSAQKILSKEKLHNAI